MFRKLSKIIGYTIIISFVIFFAVQAQTILFEDNFDTGSMSVEGESSLPSVDVKVNGSDQYIEIPVGHDNATIDWDIVCNDWAGTDCEVFLLLLRIENNLPVGVWSQLPGTSSYKNGIYPYFTGPLTDMTVSATITVPPDVLKKVWLIVDNVPNGVPDPYCMVHDHMRFMAK